MSRNQELDFFRNQLFLHIRNQNLLKSSGLSVITKKLIGIQLILTKTQFFLLLYIVIVPTIENGEELVFGFVLVFSFCFFFTQNQVPQLISGLV